MSSRFVNSHQYVGLNRVGKYFKTVPEKGPERSAGVSPASRSEKHAGETPALPNEKWRRWTGMVGADADRLSWKERKRGIRRLLKRIEMKIVVTTSVVKDAATSVVKTKRLKSLLQSEWATDLDEWARTKCAGRSLESICVEFGISRRQLNALTREYNSMSAGEIIGGYKIGGLRQILAAQLREAAFGLWGPPGEFAKRRCMVGGPVSRVDDGVPRHEAQRSVAPARGTILEKAGASGARGHATALRSVAWHPGKGDIANRAQSRRELSPPKRSRYFRTQPWEFLGVLPGDEERLRISELLGKLDALREDLDWRVDNLALQLGFENAGAFRRACMNVMGRTLEQLERILARDVVEYYLAAEDRELRELARRNTARVANSRLPVAHIAAEIVFRAREIYCGDAEVKPEAPFLDRWSATKFAKPEWIKAMQKEFG